MRIKESLKDLGLCIGYFAVGASYLAIYQKLDGKVLRSAVEFLSWIATISAAIFAMYTLNAWKRQFSHSEGYAALTRLGKVVDELISAAAHVRGVPSYEQARLLDEDDPMKNILLEDEQKTLMAWFVSYQSYCRHLDDVLVFVDPGLLSGYLADPASLLEKFNTLTEDIRNRISISEPHNQGPIFFHAVLRSRAFETELLNIKKSIQRLRVSLVK